MYAVRTGPRPEDYRLLAADLFKIVVLRDKYEQSCLLTSLHTSNYMPVVATDSVTIHRLHRPDEPSTGMLQ